MLPGPFRKYRLGRAYAYNDALIHKVDCILDFIRSYVPVLRNKGRKKTKKVLSAACECIGTYLDKFSSLLTVPISFRLTVEKMANNGDTKAIIRARGTLASCLIQMNIITPSAFLRGWSIPSWVVDYVCLPTLPNKYCPNYREIRSHNVTHAISDIKSLHRFVSKKSKCPIFDIMHGGKTHNLEKMTKHEVKNIHKSLKRKKRVE